MVDHCQYSHVVKTNIVLLEGGNCVVANSMQDEFLPCLFNVEVIPLTILLDFVLRQELFVHGYRVAGIEGVRSMLLGWWVSYGSRWHCR